MSKAGGEAAADGDKKYTVSKQKSISGEILLIIVQVLFDTSKKEMLNPNQGYKKIVQKLKTRYKVDSNFLICLVRYQQN